MVLVAQFCKGSSIHDPHSCPRAVVRGDPRAHRARRQYGAPMTVPAFANAYLTGHTAGIFQHGALVSLLAAVEILTRLGSVRTVAPRWGLSPRPARPVCHCE